MEKAEGGRKGTIVLATVKGDVHDIGKNLVDIILSQQRVQGGEPGDQAAVRRTIIAGGEGAPGGRHRAERAAGEVDAGDEVRAAGPGAAGADVSGDLRRRGADAQVRGRRSAPGVQSAVFYARGRLRGLHVMDDLTIADERRASAAGRRATRLRQCAPGGGSGWRAAGGADDGAAAGGAAGAGRFPSRRSGACARGKDFDLRRAVSYINETALFKNQWQLKTASQEDYLRLVEEKFRPMLTELEQEVIAKGWFEPQGGVRIFPVRRAEGNDGDRLRPGSMASGTARSAELLRFNFPRQREGRRLSIADFFSPTSSRADGRDRLVAGDHRQPGQRGDAEAVPGGRIYASICICTGCRWRQPRRWRSIMHKLMREELGIGGEDAPEVRDLFHQKYRGSRYSFGYPACPNLEDQTKLFPLLKPEENDRRAADRAASILEPEQSTNGDRRASSGRRSILWCSGGIVDGEWRCACGTRRVILSG